MNIIYLFDAKWDRKVYDDDNIIYELKNCSDKIRGYNDGQLIYEGE